MATPIKATPSISGADSKRFNEIINSGKHFLVSAAERERIRNLVKSVLANKDFK